MAYTAQLKQVYRYSIDIPEGTTHAKITSPIYGKGLFVTLIPHQIPSSVLELDLSELHLEELGEGVVPNSVTSLHLRSIPAVAVLPTNPFTLILDHHNPGVCIPPHATVYIRHAPGSPIVTTQEPASMITDEWLEVCMAYVSSKTDSNIAEQINSILSEFRTKIRLAHSQGTPYTGLSVCGLICKCDAEDMRYDIDGLIRYPHLQVQTKVSYPTVLSIKITHE